MRAGRMLAAGVIAAAAKTTTQATHLPFVGNDGVAHACQQSNVRSARMQAYYDAYDYFVPAQPPTFNGTVVLTYDSCTRKTRAGYIAQECVGGGCGWAWVLNTHGESAMCTTDYYGCATGWINDANITSYAYANYEMGYIDNPYEGQTGSY